MCGNMILFTRCHSFPTSHYSSSINHFHYFLNLPKSKLSLMSVPLEHDYIGLSEPSSTSKFSISSSQRDNKNVLNLKATELRLGLPGLGLDIEEGSCKNSPTKNNVAGAKRGFSDAIFDGQKRGFNAGLECEKMEQSVPSIVEEKKKASVTKSQVVGWPPIRSFRKNTKAPNSSKNGDATEGNSACRGCHYVKVSMDGAPYLRKVDLKTCKNYTQLSTALEKMFNCFTLGQCTSFIRGKEGLNESNLKDILHCAECALTYEDKDGDWMLVGDVPWEMFVDSCNRLRIMKGSEAIGLGMLNC